MWIIIPICRAYIYPIISLYQILWYYQCKLLSLPNEWGRVKLDLAWAEFAGLPGILQKCNVYKEQLDHNWFVARKPWMQTVLLPKATFRDPSIAKAPLHCIMNILTVTVCFFFCLPVFWCNLHSNPFPSLPIPSPCLLNVPQPKYKKLGSALNFGKFQAGQFDC